MTMHDLSEEAITAIQHFEAGDPNENPHVNGKPRAELIEVVAYDPKWVVLFQAWKEKIHTALGNHALTIEHVGSTAVEHLSAKPVIDIDLIVEDPTDEASYIPALENIGFELTAREPSWYQHRMLRLTNPRVNLHVFAPNCPEHLRHILFREWLTNHPDDLALYASTKVEASGQVEDVQLYNQRKSAVVREIYQRIFQELRSY